MPVLQNNLSAERAVRFVQAASKDLESSLIKLTSGNKLADPAKHSTEALIASRYRSQIQRLQAGRENLSGALSLSQTQQGYLQQVGVVLSRMGELALRAMDVTMGDQQSGGDERRFEVVTGTFTWIQAKSDAENRGGKLACIKNAEDQSSVEAIMQGASYWIGGTDEITEGQWKWVDGEAMSFQNWAAGEPNDVNGGENALQIYPSGEWNDLPTNSTSLDGYIIEFSSDNSRSSGHESEYKALAAFVESLCAKTFNQVPLFTGQTMQVARDELDNPLQTRGVDLTANTYAKAYTPDSKGYFLRDAANAHERLTQVKDAIHQLQQDQASVGAFAKGIDLADRMMTQSTDSLKDALGRLTDVNIAEESTRFARDQILRQAATAMLAQANIMPQSVLRLFDLEQP